MIEIVYKEEKQEARGNEGYFRLPKNIRQIGDCKGKQKIYLEDYVYTYLKKLSADSSSGKAAILLGQYNWADGIAYFFLRGALEITCMEVSPDNLKFDEKVWKEVSDTMNRYFKDQSILGWFLSLPGDLEENDERILKTHLNHFGGNDKVLFRMEPSEKEEAFYIYDNGALKKLGGFYIYYEKNEAMQNYMVDHNQNARVESVEQVADQAVSDFRKIVGQKQEQQKKKSGGKGLAYGVTVCAAAVVLALGLNYVTRNPGAEENQGTPANSPAVAANAQTAGENSGSAATEEQTDTREETGSVGTSSEDGQAEGENSASSGTKADGGASENMTDSGETAGSAAGSSATAEDGNGASGTEADGSGTSGTEAGESVASSAGTGETAGTTAGSSEIAEDGNGTSGTETDGSGTSGADTGETAGSGTAAGETAGSGTGTAGITAASADVLTEYTVQRGDSLSKISEKYYGTMNRVKDICAMNGITSEDVIYAGQKILLPK